MNVSYAAIFNQAIVERSGLTLGSERHYGTVQAAEALKILAGVGISLAGRLQMLDARTMQWSEMRLVRQPGCGVCGTGAT